MTWQEHGIHRYKASPSHLPHRYVSLIDNYKNWMDEERDIWKNILSSFTLSLWGTVLIPRAQTAWLSLGSSLTSDVPIALRANSTTDLIAQGARFLKERPCTRLCRWIVYSRVTTSLRAERVLPVYEMVFETWKLVVETGFVTFFFVLVVVTYKMSAMLCNIILLNRTISSGCRGRWAKVQHSCNK